MPCHLRMLRRPHPSVPLTPLYVAPIYFQELTVAGDRGTASAAGFFCPKARAHRDGGGLEGRKVDKLNVYKAHLHHHFHIVPRLHRPCNSVSPISERAIPARRCAKAKLANHVDQEKDSTGLQEHKGIQKCLALVDAQIEHTVGHHQFHIAHFHKPRSLKLRRQPNSVNGRLQHCKLRRSVSAQACVFLKTITHFARQVHAHDSPPLSGAGEQQHAV
eukprot:CAMPEP_0173079272 /NCGR_PEP_ID=MMETSP1102-20130122/14984_1 /TAXON_ID=49646 /ORGANISM="Geminigera sp., Strain Caron Lab Isolate" /LENGTH=216 /DNA_ID=CAMNT_0013951441 /DNA_START=493 /DNA_END=1144 /DNA_ORIENTATION=+